MYSYTHNIPFYTYNNDKRKKVTVIILLKGLSFYSRICDSYRTLGRAVSATLKLYPLPPGHNVPAQIQKFHLWVRLTGLLVSNLKFSAVFSNNYTREFWIEVLHFVTAVPLNKISAKRNKTLNMFTAENTSVRKIGHILHVLDILFTRPENWPI